VAHTDGSTLTLPIDPDAGAASERLAARAELILSALEAGQFREAPTNRRAIQRERLRVRGALRLFADGEGAPAKPIFTRDVHSRGLGFVTPHRLPLGYGGVIEIPNRFGRKTQIHCTLLRCREAAPGWYEGSLYFNREQHNLVPAVAAR
jgi:hypothetical protein